MKLTGHDILQVLFRRRVDLTQGCPAVLRGLAGRWRGQLPEILKECISLPMQVLTCCTHSRCRAGTNLIRAKYDAFKLLPCCRPAFHAAARGCSRRCRSEGRSDKHHLAVPIHMHARPAARGPRALSSVRELLAGPEFSLAACRRAGREKKGASLSHSHSLASGSRPRSVGAHGQQAV
jgi:hypothetical protein